MNEYKIVMNHVAKNTAATVQLSELKTTVFYQTTKKQTTVFALLTLQ